MKPTTYFIIFEIKIMEYSFLFQFSFQVVGFNPYSVHASAIHPTRNASIPGFSSSTHVTIPVYARTVGVSEIQFPHIYGGHVRLNGQEICYRSFSTTAGEMLCQSKGLKYGFHNRTMVYNRYTSQLLHCSAPSISFCYAFQRFCNEAVDLHCTVTTTGVPTLVRLVNGKQETEGRVELLHDGKWGTVCDDDFDKADGDVICKMIGYKEASQVFKFAHFSNGYGPIWLDNLQCTGLERDIADCSSNGWGNSDCGHGEDAGVSCEPYEFGYVPFNQGVTVGNPCTLTSTPCLNGGTCIVNSNYGYTCKCMEGFGGTYCQSGGARVTTKGTCHINHCQNGGTCYQNGPQSVFYCVCPNGYTGNTCQSAIIDNQVSVECMDDGWNITVNLSLLRQKYPDFNPDECYIGLDNSNCTGHEEENQLHFGQNFEDCKTSEKNLTEGVEYRNELICARHDPLYHFIIREIRLRVNLLCKFFAPLTSKDRQVHLRYFEDPMLSRSKSIDSCSVGEKLYVRAYSDVMDSRIKMILSHCYVTPKVITDHSMQYYIIKNGCVIDPNAVIFYQTAHETRFSFQYFDFSTDHDSVQLYCNATFCQTNDHSLACQPKCANHVFRSLRGDNLKDNKEDHTSLMSKYLIHTKPASIYPSIEPALTQDIKISD
ncbi:uncharacterized protein LOC111133966 isoform X2 [Crassostrea virginica]